MALGYLAAIHLPNEITCGLGTAAHSQVKAQTRASAKNRGWSLRSFICKAWHRFGATARTGEHGKWSVLEVGSNGMEESQGRPFRDLVSFSQLSHR